MKMYAMRRMGNGYTIGKSVDFGNILGFDREKVALSCNKSTQEILINAGYTPGKGNYLFNNKIFVLRDRLMQIYSGTDKFLSVKPIIDFLNICIHKSYDIRFW